MWTAGLARMPEKNKYTDIIIFPPVALVRGFHTPMLMLSSMTETFVAIIRWVFPQASNRFDAVGVRSAEPGNPIEGSGHGQLVVGGFD